MRRVRLTAGASVADGGLAVRDALLDANRLRRMDRFGRSGVLAGSRALAAAGVAPAAPGGGPDARFGVVVGTAFGCRDAITQHARLLASAARVEDLAPSVFTATVHNSVCGELAIAFGLGGPAETLVSGRTAGLEALALAASRVARGHADRMLVVGAEGIDDAMRSAWERENPGRALVESSAAVLVEAGEEEEEREEGISSSEKKRVLFVGAELTFGGESDGDFLEGVGGGDERGEERGEGVAVIERLGATGLWEIACDLGAFAEATRIARAPDVPGPHLPLKEIRKRRYTTRDVHGSCAAVTLAFFS